MPKSHPWSVMVGCGDKLCWFPTFARAEAWARKQQIAIFRADGLADSVEIDYRGMTVARVKVDGLDRVWTELIAFPGPPDAWQLEIALVAREPVAEELAHV